jgi:hypothetical protein
MPVNVGWDSLPWLTLEQELFRLQKRIYRASQRGDFSTLRRLQKLLLTSQAAKLIAVRRITQDNRGKKTAGVDGVKLIAPEQRLELADSLRHFSLIPTAQATFFLPLALDRGGERSATCCTSLAAAACCQQPSSSSTTQRTTHFRRRQR